MPRRGDSPLPRDRAAGGWRDRALFAPDDPAVHLAFLRRRIAVFDAADVPGAERIAGGIVEDLAALELGQHDIAVPGIADAGIVRAHEIVHLVADDEVAAAVRLPVGQQDDGRIVVHRIEDGTGDAGLADHLVLPGSDSQL